MKDDLQNRHRRSIRMKGFDYTQPGAYFVTICAYQREEIFGEVVEGEMRLNPFGEIVGEEWLKTAEIRSNVELHEDEIVIMPNHLHGIIWIVKTQHVITLNGSIETPIEGGTRVGATRRVAPTNEPHTLVANSIGAILGQFKTITSKQINAVRGTPGVSVWQRNYYEHIIRNENELKKIWDYIDTNPSRWQEDQLHPSVLLNRFNQDKP